MQIETKVRCLEIKLRIRVCGLEFPVYVVTRINPNASISRIRQDCALA